VTQDEARAILEEGHRRVEELLARLPSAALTRPGLGRGEWSPKDLVGHLASWESHALEALAAWLHGEPAPIDGRLRVEGLSVVNAAEVARKSAWSAKAVRDDADRLHRELLAKIAGFPVEDWNKPTTPRTRGPLWKRLGSILGGPAGSFRHVDAHLSDLAAFVDANR
jgi:hypothetical protein